MNADSRVQRNRAPYRGPVFGGDAVSAGKEKRVRDVRAVALVAPAPVPLAFRRPDAMEQRGGVQQFGIECDAAAHTDDRCKCEHAHRMQNKSFFPQPRRNSFKSPRQVIRAKANQEWRRFYHTKRVHW
ncbi:MULTISPECIES: hypothetical protein [unclassified Burkholderia]|uniref:hypothetical protein n=1 Tax=unclassified Burkholderia TaxID=2613784 RepID=UPI000F565738|nr:MULTISPECIES: hypothetical protein [unclassified Burkholderia]RQR78910.1 hypothetical protein DIE10_23035 [Burkholderia sp. Bp9011]RQR89108.1 hypothetical protein DIE09_24485 [Burkholderia sp. Bp9010]RQS57843.1 hypothetical protein DID98_18945 [Burkholderia sp. Bp8984]RQS71784.1 hypothetical protein DID97_20885 [Burkholderia sp. Bp8977]